jgi:predicted metal-dependent HD superfamily phosphohydrolase
MESRIVSAAEQWVRDIFINEFSPAYTFHNIEHVLGVKESVVRIANLAQLEENDTHILEVAALFHDVGYASARENHELVSAEKAAVFLTEQGVSSDEIAKVERLIKATYPPHQPMDKLEEIIRDADLSHLGDDNFFDFLDRLRNEWNAISSVTYKNKEWYKMNVDFLTNHSFHTEEAAAIFDKKDANLEAINKQLRKIKKKKKAAAEKKAAAKNVVVKKKPKPAFGERIMESRPAQMMFKVSLRNHIDLTNIADNKANIMLSINAIIVTIIIPLVARNLSSDPKLILPVTLLLTTCMISIIFAALVTRPIKMTGLTTVESIREGKSNLFFFGNFYKMTLTEYEEGMTNILQNEEHLNNAILRDLYFLGRALGGKYKKLRICYMVFIVGMTTTVLSFALMQVIMA